MTEVILIRHGKTFGNLKNRYIGRTDESLCRQGRNELKKAIQQDLYPPLTEGGLLFVSPMKRCRETASLIYPGTEQILVEDFRECDFGEFENQNYEEMQGNTKYQEWIDSGGTLAFPGGEDPEQFRLRSVAAFRTIVKQNSACPQMILVVHGGTIMSILSESGKPPADYYDWRVENGQGFICEKTGEGHLKNIRHLWKSGGVS